MIRFLVLFLSSSSAFAAPTSYESDVSKKILEKISERYPDCEIEVRASDIKFRENSIDQITDARILDEIRSGVFLMKTEGKDENGGKISALAEVSFSAFKNVFVASRRLQPNQKISLDDMHVEKVDVSRGSSRDIRGVLLSENQYHPRLQAKRTLLEGQFVTVDAIERMADVRRGDRIKISIQSENMNLNASGIAQESARNGEKVRVISVETKREFTGELRENSVVEVKL